MKVGWQYTCHMCSCPMNIYVIFDNITNYRYLKSFAGHNRQFTLENNMVLYKFFGLKVRRVCFGCYTTRKPNLFKREIGTRTPFVNISRTREEIYNWFSDFNEFLNKNDIELCLLPKVHQRYVDGLSILLNTRFV